LRKDKRDEEDEEEDVSSYWMTRKRQNTGNSKRKH
jgi:hypothetical protein